MVLLTLLREQGLQKKMHAGGVSTAFVFGITEVHNALQVLLQIIVQYIFKLVIC